MFLCVCLDLILLLNACVVTRSCCLMYASEFGSAADFLHLNLVLLLNACVDTSCVYPDLILVLNVRVSIWSCCLKLSGMS